MAGHCFLRNSSLFVWYLHNHFQLASVILIVCRQTTGCINYWVDITAGILRQLFNQIVFLMTSFCVSGHCVKSLLGSWHLLHTVLDRLPSLTPAPSTQPGDPEELAVYCSAQTRQGQGLNSGEANYRNLCSTHYGTSQNSHTLLFCHCCTWKRNPICAIFNCVYGCL